MSTSLAWISLGLGVGRGLAPRAGIGEEDLHAVRAELGGGVEHADAVDVRSDWDLVGHGPEHRAGVPGRPGSFICA